MRLREWGYNFMCAHMKVFLGTERYNFHKKKYVLRPTPKLANAREHRPEN